jgi:hypothetical protein
VVEGAETPQRDTRPVVERAETSRRKRSSGAQVCRDLATQDAAPVVERAETSRRKRSSGAQVCRDLATQDAAPVVELVETSRRETPRPAKVHPRGCNERRPRAATRSRSAERHRPQQRAARVLTT